jgi:predicted ATP-dependent serine protease
VREGERLGFSRFFVPASAEKKVLGMKNLDLVPVATLQEALELSLGR